jgi:hypothetical protein
LCCYPDPIPPHRVAIPINPSSPDLSTGTAEQDSGIRELKRT